MAEISYRRLRFPSAIIQSRFFRPQNRGAVLQALPAASRSENNARFLCFLHGFCLYGDRITTTAATTPVQQRGVFLAHLTPPYQPSPEGSPGRPAHRPFRGMLGSRCGLHTRAVTNS